MLNKKESFLKVDEKQGEWGKSISRDGYTPYSAPVRYPISTKETHCCKRLVRAYNIGEEKAAELAARAHDATLAARTTVDNLYKTGFINPSAASP